MFVMVSHGFAPSHRVLLAAAVVFLAQGRSALGLVPATAPLCTQARVIVLCDVKGDVLSLEAGPFPCEANEFRDDCCWWSGETLRLECGLQLAGEVLDTQCVCVRSLPAGSLWGLLTLALLVMIAGTTALRVRSAPTPHADQ